MSSLTAQLLLPMNGAARIRQTACQDCWARAQFRCKIARPLLKKCRRGALTSRPAIAAENGQRAARRTPMRTCQNLHRREIDELPGGAFIVCDGAAFAIRGNTLLQGTPGGHKPRKPKPQRISVDGPVILAVLSSWL